MGILTSSIIADSVLQYLETQNLEKAPNIECDGEDGSITITADEILEGSIKITKSNIKSISTIDGIEVVGVSSIKEAIQQLWYCANNLYNSNNLAKIIK
mgnify:CR=1 FL=1